MVIGYSGMCREVSDQGESLNGWYYLGIRETAKEAEKDIVEEYTNDAAGKKYEYFLCEVRALKAHKVSHKFNAITG